MKEGKILKSPAAHLQNQASSQNQSLNQSYSSVPQSFKQQMRDKSPIPTLEQALSDRLKAMNDYQVLQKEMRSKEQEFTKKIALYEQKIEILEIQIKEADERERNQKQMYDKMFRAIEDSNKNGGGALSSRRDDIGQHYTNTQSSVGREIDDIHKEIQYQFQERIQELESQIQKQNALLDLQEKKQQELKNQFELENQFQQKKLKDSELTMMKLEKQVLEKDFQLERLNIQVKEFEYELKSQQKNLEEEREKARTTQEKNFEELKKIYNQQVESQKKMYSANHNDHDVIEQLREELRKLAHEKIQQEELIQRLEGQFSRQKDKVKDLKQKRVELEQSEKRLAQIVAERDRELDREKSQTKQKLQELEDKISTKKDKIRELVFDYQEKEQEIERMKEELFSLRDKVKQLNKKVKNEKDQLQQKKQNSFASNANIAGCDFELCMEEECVDINNPSIINSQQQQQQLFDHQLAFINKTSSPLNPLKQPGLTGNNAQTNSRVFNNVQRSPSPYSRVGGGYCADNASYLSNEFQNNYQTPSKMQNSSNVDKMQKMLDHCVKMECVGCRKLIPTHLFYDHLISAQSNCLGAGNNNNIRQSKNVQNMSQMIISSSPIGGENGRECLGNGSHQSILGGGLPSQCNLLSKSQESLYGNNTCQIGMVFNKGEGKSFQANQFFDEDQLKGNYYTMINDKQQQQQPQLFMLRGQKPLADMTNEQLHTERSHASKVQFLEEKLRKADEVLRESSIEIKTIREERDKLKLENDRLKIQLDQVQSQLALLEEKKAENELDMKREIKYLLEKWLQNSQVKQGINNQNQKLNKSALIQGAVAQVQRAYLKNNNLFNQSQNNISSCRDSALDEDNQSIMAFDEDQIINYDDNTSDFGIINNNNGVVRVGGIPSDFSSQQPLGNSFLQYGIERQKGGVVNQNNTSIMGNFNPLTALDTYEHNFQNESNSFNKLPTQGLNSQNQSQIASHFPTQRHKQVSSQHSQNLQQINMVMVNDKKVNSQVQTVAMNSHFSSVSHQSNEDQCSVPVSTKSSQYGINFSQAWANHGRNPQQIVMNPQQQIRMSTQQPQLQQYVGGIYSQEQAFQRQNNQMISEENQQMKLKKELDKPFQTALKMDSIKQYKKSSGYQATQNDRVMNELQLQQQQQYQKIVNNGNSKKNNQS